MNRLLSYFPAAILIPCAALAQSGLELYLPDTALGSVSIDSTTSLISTLETGELGKLIPKPKRDAWLEENDEPFTLADDEEFEMPSGEPLSFRNLPELLNGRVCLAILAIDEFPAPEPEVVILADFAGDIEALTFLQKTDRGEDSSDVLIIEEPYSGTTLYLEEMDRPDDGSWMAEYWALVDGIAIEASSLEILKNTVDAVLEGSARNSLAKSDSFQRAFDISGNGQIRAFGNLRTLAEFAQEYVRSDIGELPLNPLGITFESLWNSMAVDEFDALFLSLDVEGEYVESTFGVLYEERRGVLSLLSYSGVPIERPDWVPPEAREATVSMIDFQEAFRSFETMMNRMSPNFGAMFQLQLDNLREQSGIDFRESLINNFGDRFISFTVWDEAAADPSSSDDSDDLLGTESMVVGITISDPQAFENAIKAVTEVFIPGGSVTNERQFLDSTIHTPATGVGSPLFGYALSDSILFVVVGSVDLLEQTLYRLNQRSEGLWTQRHVVNALDSLPANPVENSYYDLSQALDQLQELLDNDYDLSSVKDNIDLDILSMIDAESLPYFLISGSYVMDGAQVTRARIMPK